jgi:hypothetical protein
MRGLAARWKAWRARAGQRRAAHRLLDELCTQPDVLSQARLRAHHRHRLVILEIEPELAPIERLRLGIVRHPKSHPLQPRGEEVLEILDYRPGERTLEVVGSRNLTRAPVDER